MRESMEMKKHAFGPVAAILFIGGVAVAGAAAVAGQIENCEPARLSGRAAATSPVENASSAEAARPGSEHMAQGPMMGRGRGGMGMGRMGMGRMGMGGTGRRGGGMGRGNPVRHRAVMMNGLPAAFAGMTNPLKADAATLEKGKALYEENCASCHGAKGRGDGEAGKELDPPPADLAFIIDRPIASDGFLMWAITEGGEKLKTDMPAFGEVLSETRRWQIITWLRHGLPR